MSRVRELVQAAQFGASDPQRLQRVTTLHPRHVGYHLHAARILGWLDRQDDAIQVSAEGATLLATAAGSDAERELFRAGIARSEAIAAIAPELLDETEPDADVLCQRIQDAAGIAPATARRRASTLLRWRAQALPPARPRPVPRPIAATLRSIVTDTLRIGRVEVERYGLLRAVKVDLDESAVFVGGNASGKSTFLDIFGFLTDALAGDVRSAIQARARRFEELLWFGEGEAFAFAIEFLLPASLRGEFDRARYELEVGHLEDAPGVGVRRESLYLCPPGEEAEEIVQQAAPRKWRKLLGVAGNGQARYGSEDGTRKSTAQIGVEQLALGRLPDEPDRFPVGQRVLGFLAHGVRRIALDPKAMARPCAFDAPSRLASDGANLAAVVHALVSADVGRASEWMAHVREALPGVEEARVESVDGRLELLVGFRGGHEVPARRLSHGMLRVLGVTLVPFVAEPDAMYLVEEPENGVHPRAIEAVCQALAWSPENQILVATHSPVWLAVAPFDRLFCVVREAGAARVMPAAALECLEDWDREVDLPTLFAAGLLG
ncbi:MAG: AAA family ATPase [Myxococcales bacterium]|nr:AAA family ATPase [Myxococcales bacterium]